MATPARVIKYQTTIIEKHCIECKRAFRQMRRLAGICQPCVKIRRARTRPKTYKICEHCKHRFGPVDRLSRRFCSWGCRADHMATGLTSIRRPTRQARNAQRLVKYYVDKGDIIRPTKCEDCGCEGKSIDAAHYDYGAPLDVRWLCRSCHIKWDAKDPKGGSKKIELDKPIKNPNPKPRKGWCHSLSLSEARGANTGRLGAGG